MPKNIKIAKENIRVDVGLDSFPFSEFSDIKGKLIQYIYVGIVYKGVAFPLVWTMLDKKGNTNTRERSELFNRFSVLFGDRKIDFLGADREFIDGDWFGYLLHQPHTPFRIRIRKNTLLHDGHRQLKADACF